MKTIIGTKSHLKVTTTPVVVTVVSEPFVVLSYRGFCPVVRVRLEDGTEPIFFIGARSFSEALAPHLLGEGGDKFLGLKLRLSRDGIFSTAPYLVEVLNE